MIPEVPCRCPRTRVAGYPIEFPDLPAAGRTARDRGSDHEWHGRHARPGAGDARRGTPAQPAPRRPEPVCRRCAWPRSATQTCHACARHEAQEARSLGLVWFSDADRAPHVTPRPEFRAVATRYPTETGMPSRGPASPVPGEKSFPFADDLGYNLSVIQGEGFSRGETDALAGTRRTLDPGCDPSREAPE